MEPRSVEPIGNEHLHKWLDLAKHIQENVQIEANPHPPSEKTLGEQLLRRIPFVNKYLERLDETGEFVSAFLEESHLHASSGLHVGHIGIAALDFFRIPMMYASAFLLSKPLPFKLSRLGQFVYGGVILGLAIAGATFPPLAITFTLISSVLGLAAVGYALTKNLITRSSLLKDMAALKAQEHMIEEEIQTIQIRASELGKELKAHIAAKQIEPALNVAHQIDQLNKVFEKNRVYLQKSKDSQTAVKNTLKKYTLPTIFNKFVAFSATLIVVIGLALSFSFPPLGLSIAAGGATMGLTYLIGQYVGNKILNYLSKKSTSKATTSAGDDDHESTSDVILNLSQTPIESLRQSNFQEQEDGIELTTFHSYEAPAAKPKESPLPNEEEEEEGEGEGEHIEKKGVIDQEHAF